MRTSLKNIQAIDDYLLGRMEPGEQLLFELLHNDLKSDVDAQQGAYSLIREYGREMIRAEIMSVQATIQQEGFMQRITKLFKK